uniref:S-protein homolog n=1 Tax=Kalanchoe fedtschenkoi TaxID=63787 RepID=A0A7N0TAI7_KALFE
MSANKLSSALLILAIGCSCLLACDAKKRVRLINRSVRGQIMTERCWSSEHNLGDHAIQPSYYYQFIFNDNIWCSTKFMCHVSFPSGEQKEWLAYECNRDNCDDDLCEWTVTETSVCLPRNEGRPPLCF